MKKLTALIAVSLLAPGLLTAQEGKIDPSMVGEHFGETNYAQDREAARGNLIQPQKLQHPVPAAPAKEVPMDQDRKGGPVAAVDRATQAPMLVDVIQKALDEGVFERADAEELFMEKVEKGLILIRAKIEREISQMTEFESGIPGELHAFAVKAGYRKAALRIGKIAGEKHPTFKDRLNALNPRSVFSPIKYEMRKRIGEAGSVAKFLAKFLKDCQGKDHFAGDVKTLVGIIALGVGVNEGLLYESWIVMVAPLLEVEFAAVDEEADALQPDSAEPISSFLYYNYPGLPTSGRPGEVKLMDSVTGRDFWIGAYHYEFYRRNNGYGHASYTTHFSPQGAPYYRDENNKAGICKGKLEEYLRKGGGLGKNKRLRWAS